ncbi:MAG: 30S ribosomal protein S4e [Halobacteriota archaeon]
MHQKRISAPKSWPIAKKTHKWVVAASPGAHSRDAVPILVVLRDLLHLADNAKEAKRILHNGNVTVNGRVVKKYKAQVGLFDVVAAAGKNHRMLPNPRGKYQLTEIGDEEAKRKLARIDNITVVKGGKLQYNLHDGTNVLLEEKYSTGDSLVFSLPNYDVIDHYECKAGNKAMIVGGKHSGETGTIVELKKVASSRPNMARIERGDTQFETIGDYIFVIGSGGG